MRNTLFALRSSILSLFCVIAFLFSPPACSDPWWSNITEEAQTAVADGIQYERLLYKTVTNQPVRAHILSVTGVGENYIFGVLGSFGALFTPSDYAQRSDAIAIVNGGFFSERPSRALGLVAAHARILYLPHNGNYRGTVGFHSDGVLFDWISKDDLEANRFRSDKEGWNKCHAALAAGPILIKDSTRCLDETSKFNLTDRHPRTAIASKSGGEVLLVVVDGRQPDWSAGVSLTELTEMFKEMGVCNAMNLDGGGSASMVINEKLINRPSDYALPGSPGKERAVANVVALFKK